MAGRTTLLLNAYVSKIRTAERTRNKVELLHGSRALAKHDVDRVYEGLFIASISAFEASLEELFFGLMLRRLSSGDARVRSKITIRSEPIARDIVIGQGYLKWLPYDNTEKRARRYFVDGLPFLLGDDPKSVLRELYIVRNAIAHKSRYAVEQYKTKVLDKAGPLQPWEKHPAGFLRSIFRESPRQTRYENYIAEMVRILQIVCR